jgi:beta-glucosidase
MVGYRWYDSQRITPAYPFGSGLSYTRFAFRRLRLSHTPGALSANASVTVTNVGRRPGWAVPELYVSLPSLPNVAEPPRQLKGVAKVWLRPGQSKRVRFPLDARSFSYWSEADDGWRVPAGCNTVAVGSSSRDLPLRARLPAGGGACRTAGTRQRPRR